MGLMDDAPDQPDHDRLARMAETVDEHSREVALRVSRVLTLAVWALRIPTAVVAIVPLPFIAVLGLLSVTSTGPGRVFGLLITVAMLLVSGAFWGRRHRILQAVDDPDRLASELAIMIGLSDKTNQTRTVFGQIAGGGWQVFSRLKGLWSAAGMTGRWIDQISDLKRARYFAPPKVGTTVAVTMAALWLIPISMVACLFGVIAALAGSL